MVKKNKFKRPKLDYQGARSLLNYIIEGQNGIFSGRARIALAFNMAIKFMFVLDFLNYAPDYSTDLIQYEGNSRICNKICSKMYEPITIKQIILYEFNFFTMKVLKNENIFFNIGNNFHRVYPYDNFHTKNFVKYSQY